MPLQGWDAVRILTQIASFQALHYLILATLLPPMLAIFAETSSLMFEGGPTQVGMLFDWRQIAGRPTYDWRPPKYSTDAAAAEGWKGWTETGLEEEDEGKGEVVVDPAVLVSWNLDNVWLDTALGGGRRAQDKVLDHGRILRFKQSNTSSPSPSSSSAPSNSGGLSVEEALEHWESTQSLDARRSNVLVATWLLTVPLDIVLLVYLVRRPTHILDHALTFHLLHLLLSAYYTGAIPRGLKWWLTMLIHAAVLVVWSEQLAIKRELGRSVGYNLVGNHDAEGSADVEAARLTGKGRKAREGMARKESVVFDADEATQERIELRPLQS